MIKINNIILGIVGIAIIAVLFSFKGQTPSNYGSIIEGQAMNSTTTVTGTWANPQVLKVGYGNLGSVVITGAGAGVINVYNATTTNVSARTGQKATTTILLATIPASAAAGTYTFDSSFSDGLLVDIIGTVPTTTITYR